MPYFYLSFADPDLPEGQHFLGATIIEAESEVAAVAQSHERRINPGGEVAIWRLAEAVKHNPTLPQFLNRFVPREEVMAEGQYVQLGDGDAIEPTAGVCKTHNTP